MSMGSNVDLLAGLLTTSQAAKVLGLHPVTLAQYRVDGIGPTYLKMGRKVRYRYEDLEAYIQIVEPRA